MSFGDDTLAPEDGEITRLKQRIAALEAERDYADNRMNEVLDQNVKLIDERDHLKAQLQCAYSLIHGLVEAVKGKP